MANIREMQGGPQGPNNGNNAGLRDRSLMGYDDPPTKDPREESYREMLVLNLCPKLTFLSFTSLISFLNFGLFVAQLLVDGINKEGPFLQVIATGKMITALGRIEGPIKNRIEIWRLLTCLFLHANFDHLFFNIVSTLIWGSLVEKLIGRNRTAFIYLLAGKQLNSLCQVLRSHLRLGLGSRISINCRHYGKHVFARFHRSKPARSRSVDRHFCILRSNDRHSGVELVSIRTKWIQDKQRSDHSRDHLAAERRFSGQQERRRQLRPRRRTHRRSLSQHGDRRSSRRCSKQ